MEKIAIYKLIILYMLDRAKNKIAVPQVSNFLIENGYVDFESLVSTLSEIQDNGFVQVDAEAGKSFLVITQEGEDTLRMFIDELPEGMRAQVDRFLQDNGRALRSERDVTAEYYRSTFGGFVAHLGVREMENPLIEVSISVPDEATAKKVTENWKSRSTEVYQAVVNALF